MKKVILPFVILLMIVTSCRQGNDAKAIESEIIKAKKESGLTDTNSTGCYVEAKIGTASKHHQDLDCLMQPACTVVNAGPMSMSQFSIVLGDDSISINLRGNLLVGTYSVTQEGELSVIYAKKGDPKGFFAGQSFDESSFTLTIDKIENEFVSGTFSGNLITNKMLTSTKEFLKISEGKFKVKIMKR
jgi:hypothetical protein